MTELEVGLYFAGISAPQARRLVERYWKGRPWPRRRPLSASLRSFQECLRSASILSRLEAQRPRSLSA